MYCKYCGKEFSKESAFCNYCGKSVNEVVKTTKEDVKVFNFGSLSTNKANFNKINAWLQEQSIEISSITVNTHLYQMFFDIQTVPSRVEIKYHKLDTEKRYQMGYFKSVKMFGTGYKKVEAKLEQWKLNNPEKKVVWKTFCGYQIESGSSQSVYFLYI